MEIKTLSKTLTPLRVAGGLLGVLILYIISRHNYLLFQAMIEGFAIVVAIMIFVLANRTYKYSGNGLLLFLGNAFLFIALFDFFHAITYAGMGVFPTIHGSNITSQLWIAGRYLLAATFLLGTLVISRRFSVGLQMGAYAVVSALLLASIMWWHIFPVTYIEGHGLTAFKIASEYIVCLVILAAMLLFYLQRNSLDQTLYRVLMLSMAITILAELSFTLYVDVYGLWSFIGHIFKLVSYSLIFGGVVIRGLNAPYETIFHDLNTTAARYRTIFETTGSATVIVEEDATISLSNQEFEKLSGYRKDEIEGKKSFLEFLPVKDHERAASYQELRNSIPEDAPKHYELEFLNRRGEARSILATVEAIPGTKERVESFLDITERKHAEEALERHREHLEDLVNERTAELQQLNTQLQAEVLERKLSEERFSKAFHSGPTIGVIRSLVNDRIIDVNDTFLKTLEYDWYEAVSQTPVELQFWADQVVMAKVFRELRSKGESRGEEVELRTKSGRIITALFFAFTTEIDGESCVIINFVDITERKRLEEDLLRNSENLLLLIMDTIPSTMAYVDSQKRYSFINKAYEAWYGVNRENAPGKHVQEVMDEQTYHKLQPHIDAALSGEKVSYEIELPGKDGEKHYFYTIMVPDIDDQGTVKGYISLANDMTEFRSMEQKIAEALEFNQTIVESSPIGISIFDYSGRLIFINDAGARITGGTKEQALKQNLNFNQYDAWKQLGLQDVAREVLATGISSSDQICLKSVFGKEVWMDYNFIMFISGDEPHLLMMYEDITERKLAEKRIGNLNSDLIRRAYELTNINKELESFSYSISHDLRAPLRAINGFSQMIFNKYQDKMDDEGKEYIHIVRSECTRMGKLIDGILQLSRLSRKEIKRDELDLSVIAEGIASELRGMEPDRQVEFAITPGIRAFGDKVLLQSVLQNLLDNAWKFTSKHAQARIEFGVTIHGDSKAYFIRDDGAGFDMKYVDKLFGTFHRLHTLDEFPGDGIGLAIVQRIIHHHGGQVWAEGAVEQGATFYFTLHEQSETSYE